MTIDVLPGRRRSTWPVLTAVLALLWQALVAAGLGYPVLDPVLPLRQPARPVAVVAAPAPAFRCAGHDCGCTPEACAGGCCCFPGDPQPSGDGPGRAPTHLGAARCAGSADAPAIGGAAVCGLPPTPPPASDPPSPAGRITLPWTEAPRAVSTAPPEKVPISASIVT